MGPSGEQARKLYETGEDSSIGPLIWSKDGQRFIYVRQDESGETLLSRETKGGPITTLLRPPAMKNMTEATWLPDGRLIYSLHEPGAIGDTCNFWEMRIDIHTGETVEKPRRITNWATFCMAGMSATADSKRLAFNKWSFHFTSYVADLAAGGTHILAPRHFTLSESSDMPADWTPDSNAIIVVSNRTGRFGIYKHALNEDTAEPLVTVADSVRNPRVSPDGKWVLYFLPKERGPEPLMRVPITGGPSQLVLPARNNSQILRARPPSNLCAIAEPTEDGRQVIISALDPMKGRGPELTRFALDPNEDSWRLDLSPDGTRIAATRSPGGPIYILSLRGHPTQVIEVKGWSHLQGMDWAADGKGLFVADGVLGGTGVEVRYVDLQGNAHVLWENHEGNVTEGLPSPDGRHLAIMGLTVDGNMWMLENF